MADGLEYDVIARDKASKVLDDVAHAAGRAGDAHSKMAQHIEEGASRGGKAARLLGNTITESSAGALGPLQEIVTKLNAVTEAAEATSTKSGKALLGIGAAALGASSLLRSLASRDEEAQSRLQASIAASGKSYENYGEEIEKAVKHGEHFGNQASATLDALNRLTIRTHDPEEALRDLAVAQDVAAEKGVSLAKASEIVGNIFNGQAKAGKQFGIVLTDVKAATQGLTKAQHEAATADDRAAKARQTYADKLAVYQQTVKPTLAQQLALFRAHQAVEKAADADAAAHDRLKEAQKRANEATRAGEENVRKLAAVVKGQGEANADSFSGRLRALGATIEDTGAKLGHDYGPAIQTASVLMIAAGSAAELGLGAKLKAIPGLFTRTSAAAEASAAATSSAVAAEASAVEGSTAAIDAALASTGATAVEAAAAIEGASAAGAAAVASEATSIEASSARAGFALNGLIGKLGVLGAAYAGLQFVGSKLQAHADANPLSQQDFLNQIPSSFRGDAQQIFDAQNASQAAIDNGTSGDDGKLAQQRNTYTQNHPATTTRTSTSTPRDPSLQDFLNSIGGGGVANAKADAAGKSASKAASDASKAAEAAAKAAIKAYQDELRTRIAVDEKIIASDKKLIDADQAKISRLKDQQKAYADYAKGIADTAKQFDNVISAFGSLGQDGSPATINGLMSSLEDKNALLGRLTVELPTLKMRGLNSALVDQLYQAGPDQAQLIDTLYNATPEQIRQINLLAQTGDFESGLLGDLGTSDKFGVNAEANTAKALDRATSELKQHTTLLTKMEKDLAVLDKRLTDSLNGVASKSSTTAAGRPRG